METTGLVSVSGQTKRNVVLFIFTTFIDNKDDIRNESKDDLMIRCYCAESRLDMVNIAAVCICGNLLTHLYVQTNETITSFNT
jgi:hypothetical protein